MLQRQGSMKLWHTCSALMKFLQTVKRYIYASVVKLKISYDSLPTKTIPDEWYPEPVRVMAVMSWVLFSLLAVSEQCRVASNPLWSWSMPLSCPVQWSCTLIMGAQDWSLKDLAVPSAFISTTLFVQYLLWSPLGVYMPLKNWCPQCPILGGFTQKVVESASVNHARIPINGLKKHSVWKKA